MKSKSLSSFIPSLYQSPPHQGVFTHLSIIFSACWWIYIRYSVHHIRTISLSICRQSQWINEWICCCNRTASFESNFAQMVKHTQSRKNVGHSDAGVWIPIVGTKMEEPIFLTFFHCIQFPWVKLAVFVINIEIISSVSGPKFPFANVKIIPSFHEWIERHGRDIWNTFIYMAITYLVNIMKISICNVTS